MALFNLLTNDTHLTILIALVVTSLLSLVASLLALFIGRQGNQRVHQRVTDLSHQLIEQQLEQQEDYKKLEQLQNSGDQRHQLMDQVIEDLYSLIRSNSQQLNNMQNQPIPPLPLSTEAPSQNNYSNAIRMAQEGMSGEKIQHLYGLTEGEVNLILDLHQ